MRRPIREAFDQSLTPAQLYVVSNGEQAVKSARRADADALRRSLILLDLSLPVRNGRPGALPWHGGWNAGRIRREHLREDAPGGLVRWDLLGPAEECVPRRMGKLQAEALWAWHLYLCGGRQLTGAVGQIGERADEPGGCLLAVSVGELGAYPAVVTYVQVDVVLLAQPVGGVVAVDAEPGDVDYELQGIQLHGQSRPAELRLAMHMHPADVLYISARVWRRA